ncbi:MAG: MFS transporter, partial [Saprospiraceae bacterium]|nr:MFS transporter [Saprospiraceae bacterium]
LGIGFLFMVSAAQIATSGMKAGMFMLILTYFFHSIGELFVSPVGLSNMTKLSPPQYTGQMMGLWFVATALGNLIAGTFGGHFDPSNVQQMPELFMTFVKLPVGVGLIFLAFSPIVRRWMGEIH